MAYLHLTQLDSYTQGDIRGFNSTHIRPGLLVFEIYQYIKR